MGHTINGLIYIYSLRLVLNLNSFDNLINGEENASLEEILLGEVLHILSH